MSDEKLLKELAVALRGIIYDNTERLIPVCTLEEEVRAIILPLLAAALPALRPTQEKFSCGCVSCICENDTKCGGCGAKACASFPNCEAGIGKERAAALRAGQAQEPGGKG